MVLLQPMLKSVVYSVKTIDDGRVAWQGHLGMRKSTMISQWKNGEILFIPAVLEGQLSQVVACRISCRTQIEDGTGRSVNIQF